MPWYLICSLISLINLFKNIEGGVVDMTYHSEETGTRIDLDFVIYISDVFCPFFGEPYFYFLVIDDTEEIKAYLLPPKRKIERLFFWKRIKKIKEVRFWFFESWIKIQRERRG